MIIQFNTGKTDILLVKVQDGAKDLFIHDKEDLPTMLMWSDDSPMKIGFIKLPTGNWQIVGNPFELSEEQCQRIMPIPAIRPKYGHPYGAVPALHSWTFLLRDLKVYAVNPYGEKSSVLKTDVFENANKWVERANKWSEAEDRTGRWILLTAIKA